MGDEGNAACPEARVLVGARDLLGEFRREGAIDGRSVAADLLEHAAMHERHDAAAAVGAAVVLARPGGPLEAAGLLPFAAGHAFGVILDSFEAGTNQPLKLGEPGARAILPGLAEGLGEVSFFGCLLVHHCHVSKLAHGPQSFQPIRQNGSLRAASLDADQGL